LHKKDMNGPQVVLREAYTPDRKPNKAHRSGWLSNSSKKSSCSQVKSEPEDSLEQTPAEEPPAWAAELIGSLREAKVPMPAKAEPVIQKAMSGLEDGPAWALELHQLLEGRCSTVKTEPPPEQPSTMTRLRSKLCPKGNLSLRLTNQEEAGKLSDWTTPSLSEPPAEKPDNETAATERMPIAAYELVASEALKTVKAKRAEAAAEKKRTKQEEQTKAKGDLADHHAKAAVAKQAAKGKDQVANKAGQKPAAKKAEPVAKKAKPKAKTSTPMKAAVMKRPAACVIAYSRENPPKCPKPEDKEPIEYHGGKIYNCELKFRVLRKKNDAYNEKSFSHKKWGRKEGFKQGLKVVEEYWDAKKALEGVEDGEDVS
jgi:hypothetical protein